MKDKDLLRKQILHVLSIYPVISPTMLQAALGPQKKPKDWRPILEELITIGHVEREMTQPIESPAGRFINYTKIRLAPTKIQLNKNRRD